MAEDTEAVEFWKGVVVGTLFGLVAAAYARGEFRRLLSFARNDDPTLDPKSDQKPGFRDHSRELKLRREASENAGDPTRLSPAVPANSELAPQTISIERAGGAPGPASTPEIMEAPGHPGQMIDHSDAAQAVRSAARTQSLTGS